MKLWPKDDAARRRAARRAGRELARVSAAALVALAVLSEALGNPALVGAVSRLCGSRSSTLPPPVSPSPAQTETAGSW